MRALFIYFLLPVDCKIVGFFFLKSVKKLVKRGEREKNRLLFFRTMSSLRPGGSQMSSSCQKSVHNSALFVNLIHSVIDFEGEKRVLLSAFGFES